MKRMKNTIALILAVALMFSLTVTVSAVGEGSITINGVSESNVYSIYKLLDLESYNKETGVYSYKVNSAWTGFFETDDAKEYFTVDAQGYATWTNTSTADATVAAFAKLALAYAQEQVPVSEGSEETKDRIDPVQSSHKIDTETNELVPSGDFVIVDKAGTFDELALGYYLIDSTMGALCGLTTTNPNASIQAKNDAPTIDKQVKEDLTGNWGDTNTADIGQTVHFRTTINVHAGAQNFVLHDTMSDGLTFQGVEKVELTVSGGTMTTVPTTAYTVNDSPADEHCTFEVVFTQEFCDALQDNDKIIVYYSAMLNRDAVIAGEGNDNTAQLEFGEEHFTTEDETQTYTFGFDIIKTDSQNVLIDGAEFRIYDAAEGGNEIGVVLMDDGVTYRRARADEQAQNKHVPIVVEDGQVRVVGFDNGDYWLEETVTPEGYNQLAARQKFTISDKNLDAVFNDGIFSTGSGVHVVNKSGTMLPETGGMGTTLFITFGLFAVLGTGVLLVTKKRMGMIQD